MSCIFCQIIARKSPAEILYQDELVTAFRDKFPVAPVHILVVPNRHIPSTTDITAGDEWVLGHLFCVARDLAVHEGIEEHGYRLIVNTGPDGGQVIYHFHLHLIGGRRMQYPMG